MNTRLRWYCKGKAVSPSQSWSVPICPWKAFSVPVEDGVSSSVPSQMVCPGHSRPVPVSLSHCEVNWGIFSYLKEVLLNSSPSSKLLAVPSFSPLSLSNLRISIIQKSYCLAIELCELVFDHPAIRHLPLASSSCVHGFSYIAWKDTWEKQKRKTQY